MVGSAVDVRHVWPGNYLGQVLCLAKAVHQLAGSFGQLAVLCKLAVHFERILLDLMLYMDQCHFCIDEQCHQSFAAVWTRVPRSAGMQLVDGQHAAWKALRRWD